MRSPASAPPVAASAPQRAPSVARSAHSRRRGGSRRRQREEGRGGDVKSPLHSLCPRRRPHPHPHPHPLHRALQPSPWLSLRHSRPPEARMTFARTLASTTVLLATLASCT